MNTLAIVLVFLFTATMVVVGAMLVGVGVRRLQHVVQGGDVSGGKALQVSMDVLIAAFGLLLAFYGALSTFRIVWGS